MKEKMYLSTRGDQKPLNFYEAILQGIGSDGGDCLFLNLT